MIFFVLVCVLVVLTKAHEGFDKDVGTKLDMRSADTHGVCGENMTWTYDRITQEFFPSMELGK